MWETEYKMSKVGTLEMKFEDMTSCQAQQNPADPL